MDQSNENSLRRTTAVAALLLLFGFLSYIAGKEALSDLYARAAVQDLAGPALRAPAAQADQWQRARQDIADSLRHSPDNPRTLEEAGRQDLLSIGARIDGRPLHVAARSAYRNSRMALTVRPVSADAWAYLAQSKFFLGEWDEEMFQALRHADQLGPWEYPVQHVIIFVSVNAWRKLDDGQRAATHRIVERAMRRNADQVAQLLKVSLGLSPFCDSAIDAPRVRALCSQLRKPAAPQKPQAR